MHSGMTAFVTRGKLLMPLTDQVENVTENDNSDLSQEDAYDKEWESEDISDQDEFDTTAHEDASLTDSNENVDQGKAEETTTTSETVVDDTQGGANSSDNNSAESGVSDDIWAKATDAQRLAFTKAQNDLNRETSRARSQQRLSADLQKELDKTKAANHELTREKGSYEKEHPELFTEVYDRFKSEFGETTQPTDTDSGSEEIPDDIKLVFRVHPDANDLMQTPEWGQFASNLTVDQKAQLESDDPVEFISLVTEYKTQQRIRTTSGGTSGDALEDTVTAPGGSSSAASQANRRALSTEEQYDAEWANDD